MKYLILIKKWFKRIFGKREKEEVILSPSYLVKFICEDGDDFDEDSVMCDNEAEKDAMVDKYMAKDEVMGIVVYREEPKELEDGKYGKCSLCPSLDILDCVCRLKRVNGEWARNDKK